MERLKVKNDFIFQRIFGRTENKEILISFLNAVLMLEGEHRLDDIEIMENTKLERDRPDDKLGILDVRAKTVEGVQINIEVQLVNQYNMDRRTLFYWARLFYDQLEDGQPFQELKKTITINILDFQYIGIDSYHTVFHLWEDNNKDYKLSDVLEIRFIELPKFRKVQPDLSKPLDRWLLFIEDSPKEVIEMIGKSEPAIEKAEKVLEYLGTNEEIKYYYELREKAIRDEISRVSGAKEEGLNQGRMEGKLETARNLLGLKMDVETISKATGLPVSQIEDMQKSALN